MTKEVAATVEVAPEAGRDRHLVRYTVWYARAQQRGGASRSSQRKTRHGLQ
jgi:hypothetical protein